MRSFLDWIDQSGFWTDNTWDISAKKWVGTGKLQLFDFQRRVLDHLFTPDSDGNLKYRTVVYSTIKKSGKSKIAAAVSAWVAEDFPEGSQIFICANDLEQAQNIVFSDVRYHVRRAEICLPAMKRIDYPNGNLIMAIAQHYASAAGSRHVLSVWDELWAYESSGAMLMWAEMTPPPTIPNAFRLIVTYAGYENQSGPLRTLYDDCWVEGTPVAGLEDLVNTAGEPICRKRGDTFIMWDDVPRMPWQTDAYYESQMTTLRPEDFLRQHRNQWVSGSESFIPVDLWDKCVTLDGPLIYKPDEPKLGYPISVGVDIGIKHDCSAVVGVGYDVVRYRPFLAFARVWTPGKGDQIDIENTVEKFLVERWRQMRVTDISYDPVQFHRSATTLTKMGLPLIEYPQTESNMTVATQTLYDLIRSGGIDLYADEELRDHVRHSPVKHSSRGIRIQKDRNAKFKIDAAVALAMACYMAVKGSGRITNTPLIIASPFSDSATIRIPSYRDQLEARLPEPLRSKHYEQTEDW